MSRTLLHGGSFFVVLSFVTAPVRSQDKPNPVVDPVQQAHDLGSTGNWKEAAVVWQRVVEANPTQGESWERLAWSHFSSENYTKAIPAYEKAFELRHGYPANVAYQVACCHARLGDKAAAMKWLEQSLYLGYRYPKNAHTESHFESIRTDPKFREMVYLTDVSKMSRDEGFRYDLKMLAREIQRMHYNPYRRVTREQFEAQVRKLHDDIPKLNDDQVRVGFTKIACLAGDGHTSVHPSGPREIVPLQLYQFKEGVFVTAADPAHADLAGAEILKVGTRTTAETITALEPVIQRDNAMGISWFGPIFLTYPRLMYGFGLSPSPDKLPLTIRDATGKERSIELASVKVNRSEFDQTIAKWVTPQKGATRPVPLAMKNRSTPYWFEYLPDHKTVYFQFNAVRNEGKESLKNFCERLFTFVNENEVNRLVLDIRWNGGGNTFLVKPLIHGLIKCDKINKKGKLFVIIGRNTFSAAQNMTVDIETNTEATFVGEPTGSSPSFIGETILFTLPYSKMDGSISDLLWQRSWPMDYRTWIAPDIYAPPSFALYKENRDPAMEAILNLPSK